MGVGGDLRDLETIAHSFVHRVNQASLSPYWERDPVDMKVSRAS